MARGLRPEQAAVLGLWRQLHDRPADAASWGGALGPPRLPSDWAGSWNHVTLSRAAQYLHDGDPAWWRQWLDDQLAGEHGFYGKEQQSAKYRPFMVASVAAALHAARRRRHPDVVEAGERWMRRDVALTTLFTVPWQPEEIAEYEGPYVAAPCCRTCPAWSRGNPWSSAVQALLLGLPHRTKPRPREHRVRTNVFSHAILELLQEHGERFGIGEGLAADLRRHVERRDRAPVILGEIAGTTLQAPLQLLETAAGFSAWIARNVNGNDAACFAQTVRFPGAGSGPEFEQIVLPPCEAAGVPAGSCRREADRLEAEMTYRTTRYQRAIPVAPEAPRLHLELGPAGLAVHRAPAAAASGRR
jgi:hypothetical protein